MNNIVVFNTTCLEKLQMRHEIFSNYAEDDNPEDCKLQFLTAKKRITTNREDNQDDDNI